jgi:hypothetical protein
MLGSKVGERYWEGEGIAARGMIGGARVAVREKGEVSWVELFPGELGRLVSRVRPKWAAGVFLLFFSLCFLFLLFLISVLSF